VYVRLETQRVRLGYEEKFINTWQGGKVELVVVVRFLRLFQWKRFVEE
jgi:hypothetical protein